MPFVALQGRSLQSATIGYAITPNPVRPCYLFNHFIAHSAKGEGQANIPQFCYKLRNEKRMRFLGW